MDRILLTIVLFMSGIQFSEAGKPNIILIVADDLGYADVGFNGSEWYETPVLDALANESLVLDYAYMYPTCSPSRAALLTGKQSFRTGVYTVPVLERGNARENIFSRWTVGKEHTVFAEPLRDAGYRSIHLGKWHIVGPDPEGEKDYPFEKKLKQPANGDTSWIEKHKSPELQAYYPTGRGFDENIGGTWWGDPARGYVKGYSSGSGGYVAPFKNPFIEDKESDYWLTDRLTDEAIRFMERHKTGPFLVNLDYYAPHRPSVKRSEALYQKYINKPGDADTGQGVGDNRKEMAAYATMVEALDQNVGRILHYLDESGLRENTVIIFTSDNGFNGLQSRNNNLRGAKGYVYEGGIRVPAIINWKNKIKNRRSQVPITGMDLFPTFLELADVTDFAGTLDGNSLVPLFESDRNMQARDLFWHIASSYKNPPCSIIRSGEWKLIQFLNSGEIELYNLREDPLEGKNMAIARPELAASLVKKLSDWRKANNAPLPPISPLGN